VLLWVGFRLLEVSEAAEEHKQATTLLGAIGTILLADVIMSLDNVLGVAAVSHGEVILLAFGLIVSMAVLMVAGGLIAELIDRLWWLAYLGAAGVPLARPRHVPDGHPGGAGGPPPHLCPLGARRP